jgi:hypothetical protein
VSSKSLGGPEGGPEEGGVTSREPSLGGDRVIIGGLGRGHLGGDGLRRGEPLVGEPPLGDPRGGVEKFEVIPESPIPNLPDQPAVIIEISNVAELLFDEERQGCDENGPSLSLLSLLLLVANARDGTRRLDFDAETLKIALDRKA